MAEQIKGGPVRMFAGIARRSTGLSDERVDCRGANAVTVQVIGQGLTTVTMQVQGSDTEGGVYITLPDPQASQTITANDIFDVVVGTQFVAVNISAITGGVIVIVTPYVSPGQTQVNVTNTASQNLAQVGGSTISAVDVDTDAGDTEYVVPVAIRLPGATPATAPGDSTNGLDVDVTRLPALPAGTNAIGKLAANSGVDIGDVNVTSVPTQAYSAAVTITRPANVTAYTARDVLGGAIEFTSMGPNAGRIMLTSVQLEADIAAIPAGMGAFSLYLYNVTPPSALADNAAFDIPAGDRASFLGKISLGSLTDEGSTLYVEQASIQKQLKLSGTSLFGYLVPESGFTPAGNSEVYVLTLHSVAL